MFGFGDKNKVHKVTIANTGETFEVTGKINLLQAALNAGIDWPCECRVGSCGTCRVILKEGKVKEHRDYFDFCSGTFGNIPVIGAFFRWLYSKFVD